MVAIAIAVLATSAQRWCNAPPCAYIETSPPLFRSAYVNSWGWLAANIRGATIAYTGINLPYPLAGPRLTNRVVYVNIDGRAHWRLHDYDRAFRSGRFAPDEPRLATSSGELLPVGARTGPRDDASRPRYERMQGIPEAWAYALESAGVRYLYVAALSAYEIRLRLAHRPRVPHRGHLGPVRPHAIPACLRKPPGSYLFVRTGPEGTRVTAPSLSIVIPAYNEAGNIVGTLDNVTAALSTLPLAAEIVVVDDGSRDDTAALVRDYAARVPNVRLLVNPRNLGFGATYRRGVAAATSDYIVMVHGDNAWGAETLHELFAQTGNADIVIGYTRNMWRSRPFARTVVSKAFTMMVNTITRRRLKDYNGLQIHRAGVLKSLAIESSGFGFQAEVLVKALSVTRTSIQVPMDLTEREHGASKAFRWKNAVDVARTLWRLRASATAPVR